MVVENRLPHSPTCVLGRTIISQDMVVNQAQRKLTNSETACASSPRWWPEPTHTRHELQWAGQGREVPVPLGSAKTPGCTVGPGMSFLPDPRVQRAAHASSRGWVSAWASPPAPLLSHPCWMGNLVHLHQDPKATPAFKRR